jgi:two-component system nitrate/nitrite response regulator NarL
MADSNANYAALPALCRSKLEPRPEEHRNGRVVRVLVVDNHPITRAGVTALLACHNWLNVVGQAGDGYEGLQKARELSPDLILVDTDLPKFSGLALTKILRAECPDTRIAFLSMHPPARVAAASVTASGAHGYVWKGATTTELIRAFETIASGGTYFGTEFNFQPNNQQVPERPTLSPRETEVLTCIADGLSNKEISVRLRLGVRTVETHRESLMRKLNIYCVASLTMFAIQHGLVQGFRSIQSP